MERHNRFSRYIYWVTLLFLVLTGFGQMPVFKRYYIADIPGFAWLAKFFVTHYMHYLFAAVFIGLTAYILVDYILITGKMVRLSLSGYIRSGIILGLIVTGVLLVIRNLSGIYFSTVFIIVLDLSHLGLCVVLLVFSLYTVLTKKRWLELDKKDKSLRKNQ